MKKQLTTFVVFAGIIAALSFTTGCKKTPAPTTCFNSIPDTAVVGQQITFTSCTNGASSFYWLFGDGGYATTATATHTYTAPGIYNGGLTTSNGTGDTKSFKIVVLRPYNIWTFQGITDTAFSAAVVGDTLQASNFSATNLSNISNIILVFSSIPTTGGSYQVVNDQFSTPNASQIAVFVTTPSGRNYGSTGRDGSSAVVTVNGGKIKVSLPSVMMVNVAVPSDSAALSATITQTE